MSEFLYRKGVKMLPVEQPVLLKKYHVSWAKNGCVWKCIEINNDGTVILETPKTKKRITVRSKDLRHTRFDQYKIEQLNPTDND